MSPAAVVSETRTLECLLSDPEKVQRGEAMSAAELEIEQLQMQRKGLNGQIAALREQRNKLAHVLDTQRETRPVQCHWEADYAAGTTHCIREDTGEVIEQRPLTADETQVDLTFDGDEEPAPAPPPAPAPRRGGRRARPPLHHEHASQ